MFVFVFVCSVPELYHERQQFRISQDKSQFNLLALSLH